MSSSVIGVAIGAGVSLTLLVLAAALDNVWWPLLMLIPLALLPAPAFLASKGASDDPGFGNPDGIAYVHWASFGAFCAAVLAVSPIAMMSVFFHLEIITARALAFSIASLVTLVIVGVAYAAPSGWTCLRGISSTGSTGSGSAKLLF